MFQCKTDTSPIWNCLPRLRFFTFLGRFAQRGGLVPNQGGRLDAAIAGLPDAGQLESFDTKDDPSPPPTDQGSSDDVAFGDEGAWWVPLSEEWPLLASIKLHTLGWCCSPAFGSSRLVRKWDCEIRIICIPHILAILFSLTIQQDVKNTNIEDWVTMAQLNEMKQSIEEKQDRLSQ